MTLWTRDAWLPAAGGIWGNQPDFVSFSYSRADSGFSARGSAVTGRSPGRVIRNVGFPARWTTRRHDAAGKMRYLAGMLAGVAPSPDGRQRRAYRPRYSVQLQARSTARFQIAWRASRSSAEMAGSNTLSARHVAANASGEA